MWQYAEIRASPAKLAGAVGRDGRQRTMVLVDLFLAKVAVNAAAGCVHDPSSTRHPHRFQNMVGENVPESKSIAGSTAARAMSGFDARWMTVSIPRHSGSEVLEVGRVPSDDAQPRVFRVLLEMPFSPGGEIVENGRPTRWRLRPGDGRRSDCR